MYPPHVNSWNIRPPSRASRAAATARTGNTAGLNVVGNNVDPAANWSAGWTVALVVRASTNIATMAAAGHPGVRRAGFMPRIGRPSRPRDQPGTHVASARSSSWATNGSATTPNSGMLRPDISENARLIATTPSVGNDARRGRIASVVVAATMAMSANRATWKSGDMYSFVLLTRYVSPR